MSGAPKIYGKSDLRKLADSKAVPLIAHSHEVIVPVVYSGMVKKFLEDKGVKLPLTQAQLAEMKREAKAVGSKDVGHAKGGTVKQSMKNVQAVSQKANQKVIINLGTKKRGKPRKRRITRPSELMGGPSLYDQLRPSAWHSFRPITSAGFTNPLLGDYKKEAEEHLKKEKDALELYKKEVEEKARDSLKDLEDKKREQERLLAALFRPAESFPVRSGHSSFPSTPGEYEYITPDPRSRSSYPGTPRTPVTLVDKFKDYLKTIKTPPRVATPSVPTPPIDYHPSPGVSGASTPARAAPPLYVWDIVKEGSRWHVKRDGVSATSFKLKKEATAYVKENRGF